MFKFFKMNLMISQNFSVKVLAKIGLIISTLSILTACTYLNLGSELDSAKKNLFLIKTSVDSSGNDKTIAVLFRQSSEGKISYVSYRVAKPGQDLYFIMPKGDYDLVAFKDLNNDYKYQQGEPVGIKKDITLHQAPINEPADNYASSIIASKLMLNQNTLDESYKIDLSVSTLQTGATLKKFNYLEVVKLSDPRFSLENTHKGMWKPHTFLKEIGYGIYLLDEWDKNKTPLVLVHGITSSPPMWESLIKSIDTTRYQIMLYHYPSAEPLSKSSYYLREALIDINNRNNSKISILAHSMGGLVARGAIQYLSIEERSFIDLFLTMSTPWGGNTGAQFAVNSAPIVAPVWKDLTPESQFLTTIFKEKLTANIQHIVLVSYAGDALMVSEKNDGSVTLKSELKYQVQDEAEKVYLINADHVGIYSDRKTHQLVKKYLSK